MIVHKFDSEDAWLEARRGKITGTRAGNLVLKRGGGYKMGFYELLAERIGIPASDENVMDRGHRLEAEAIEHLSVVVNKKFDTSLVIWEREDMPGIAVSPDGFKGKQYAAEAKCLSSARHLEAWHTRQIPSEYESQAIQYFVVNDKLKSLYFCFYDPRLPVSFFYIELTRAAMQDKIDEYLTMEKEILQEIEKLEEALTF